MVEHLPSKHGVLSSNPTPPIIFQIVVGLKYLSWGMSEPFIISYGLESTYRHIVIFSGRK
jgi:hypothetical protein